jgi:TP901 family phage tail tape measure protein
MSAFVIPSIFTAIDKMTAPLKRIRRSMDHTFADASSAKIARWDRSFNRLTPGISDATKQMFSFASAAAVAAGITAGIAFSGKSVMDYESAVASFRTIVSDLNDADFQKYKDKISEVAKSTNKSTIDTAQAFEKIAGLNAKFADTADSIGQVSKAAITLSKASGEELGTSAESLVGIMNQFSFAANQADRTINVLAAGAGVGAASIAQTSEAFVNFGSVAAGANISLEQSVGLVQTLGKYSVFGAEAGTKLRGAVLKLQKAGVGYASGQFQINDALEEARKKVDKLKTAKQKDAAILEMFGAENIATGRILLNSIDTYKEFTNQVTNTSEAQKQAALRSNTLSNKLDELKSAWVNMLTGSEKAGTGLEIVKNIIGKVSENLGTIVGFGAGIIGVFIAWKAVIIASKVAMVAYNIVLGINNALTGASAFTVMGNTVAYGAFRTAVILQTAALKVMNAVMNMSPLGLAITATLALTAAAYGLHKIIKSNNIAQSVSNDIHQRVLDNTIEQRVEVVKLFTQLKTLKTGTDAYKDTLKKIDDLQPGITSKYNLQAGAIQNMAAAERELTANIMKRAEAEAKAQLLTEAIRNKLQMEMEGPSMMQKFTSAIGGPDANLMNRLNMLKEDQRINTLASSMSEGPVSNKANAAIMNNKTEANFTINAPAGTTITENGNNEGVSANIMPSLGSTSNWNRK